MIDKIWEFLKKNWMWIAGIVAGAFAAIALNDKKKPEGVEEVSNLTEEEKKRAEKEEADRIEAARQAAEAQKKVNDELARLKRIEEEAKINERVETEIKKDVENGQQLAKDLASDFGADYVKNDEK
jgi:uncharacterized membrane protein YcjF (UPF0283 family)